MSTTPAGLTYSTTPIQTSYDGQVIENLDLWVTSGNAITVTNDNVIIRNCIIHHVSGNGVLVDGASNVTVEDSEIVNASPPSGTAGESTSTDIDNIWVTDSPGFTADRVTLHDGATGIYVGNSPGAALSNIEGYNFHGPFPAGQFVQFYKSGNSSLSDFYAYDPAGSSRTEDIVSVIDSPNVAISRGVIDGDNSPSGVGVMFEGNSGGGKVDHVDAIHMGDGAFSSYSDNVSFNYTRSFDNIDADQGRGVSLSNGLIWNVSGSGVSIANSTYTRPGNPDNIVWQDTPAVALGVKEAPNATPMTHISNVFDWIDAVPYDFNGDGKSDILWRNANGDVVLWQSNGAGGYSGQDYGVVDNSYQIAGIDDFNGDGKSDILWRNANGDALLWNSNGSRGFSGLDLGIVDNSYRIAATVDFNGDGMADILWRNANGDAVLWKSNGSGGFTGQDFGVVDNSYRIAATDDFNGDGMADILWRNTNGDVAVWQSNGSGGFTGKDLGVVDNGYQVAGTSDFNGDGKADILWRNANGDAFLWKSNGSGGFAGQDLGVVDTSYQVAAISDLNGDGKADILWRNASGDALAWDSNASGGFAGHDLGMVASSWKIQAP